MAVRSMSIGHRDGPLPSASNDGMGCGFGPSPYATPAPYHNKGGSVQVRSGVGVPLLPANAQIVKQVAHRCVMVCVRF